MVGRRRGRALPHRSRGNNIRLDRDHPRRRPQVPPHVGFPRRQNYVDRLRHDAAVATTQQARAILGLRAA